jgi:hypothetical protein
MCATLVSRSCLEVSLAVGLGNEINVLQYEKLIKIKVTWIKLKIKCHDQ